MGYSVDLQRSDLGCRTEADAEAAAALVGQHEDMCPYHVEVSPRSMSNPPRDDSWSLEIDHFAGDHWHDDEAKQLWLALAPHMDYDATIEFQDEEGTLWRIRWSGGRVYEEFPKHVVWALEREITAAPSAPADKEQL